MKKRKRRKMIALLAICTMMVNILSGHELPSAVEADRADYVAHPKGRKRR